MDIQDECMSIICGQEWQVVDKSGNGRSPLQVNPGHRHQTIDPTKHLLGCLETCTKS